MLLPGHHRFNNTMREWCSLQAGKLDLTEVEGLADLLAADTEAQRIQVSSAHLLELLRHRAKTWKGCAPTWNARCVYSPGSARRTPGWRCSAWRTARTTAGPPCVCSSTTSSPVYHQTLEGCPLDQCWEAASRSRALVMVGFPEPLGTSQAHEAHKPTHEHRRP